MRIGGTETSWPFLSYGGTGDAFINVPRFMLGTHLAILE